VALWLPKRRFFRTYSPQGDGNLSNDGIHWEDLNIDVFQNLFPARGRKRLGSVRPPPLFLASGCFSEPIPRKGTETPRTQRGAMTHPIAVFQNLFPARGRKRWTWHTRMPLLQGSFFRTYSPQGDGNLIDIPFGISVIIQNVFQNLFPARGRKLLLLPFLVCG